MQKKPKILLINPTGLYRNGKPITQSKTYLPGLTMLQLGAYTPDHFEVKVISESSEKIPYHEHWDLVGIGGMGGSGLVRGWQLADYFKNKGSKVVMGGIAASLCHQEWTLEHAHTLVTGEAEDIWGTVLADFLKGEMKQKYQMTQPPDITKFKTPAYHLLNKRNYGFWRPVQATRGCPFTCTFCSISEFFQQSYRKRSIEQIIRDVRAAKKHRTRYITFVDDNIGVDFKFCKDLWEALIPEDIIWASQCSLQIGLNEDMLALAYKSGCRILSFGVESVNKASLKSIDKEWNNPESYAKAFSNIKKHGIEISTEMIVGIDGDDKNVFEDTFNFLMNNRIALPRLYIITPVPGTPFYREMEAEGRICDRDFSKYNGGDAVFRPKQMTTQELQHGYWKLYKQLYSLPNIYKRLAGNEAKLSAFMRLFVWGTNLHYRKHIKHEITPGIV
ncbi:MAG: B12-binding domain-containing radical SAM protein [Raineya sp.]|jgi:radical SAM superfamily enzyme YgiQ (UPF0313 family)|nr:B12-binding domain-containing radical SAM protein [Raineya sp.]